MISARLWFAGALANTQCSAYTQGLAQLLESSLSSAGLSWKEMCASNGEKLGEGLGIQ